MKKLFYLGRPASFSFIAGKKFFQNASIVKNMIGCASIPKIFEKVAASQLSSGVVPLENSTAGSIAESFDMLKKGAVSITGEIYLKINLHLIGAKSAKKNLKQTKECYSHPFVFDQCRSFFKSRQWIEQSYVSDSSLAVKLVSKKATTGKTAIGSSTAAQIYNLSIWEKNIQDCKKNTTRFAIISKMPKADGNKISLAFTLPHVPGSLISAIKPLSDKKLNITKIESRPIVDKPWEYVFFLDFELKNQKREAEKALLEVKKRVGRFYILGCYQKGSVYES